MLHLLFSKSILLARVNDWALRTEKGVCKFSFWCFRDFTCSRYILNQNSPFPYLRAGRLKSLVLCLRLWIDEPLGLGEGCRVSETLLLLGLPIVPKEDKLAM